MVGRPSNRLMPLMATTTTSGLRPWGCHAHDYGRRWWSANKLWRRRNLEHLPQPTHSPVLSGHNGQCLSRTVFYGAQQDNSTVRIPLPHRGLEHWWRRLGRHCRVKVPTLPWTPKIPTLYGGSHDGFLTRVNHKTGNGAHQCGDNPMGHGAEDFKYRFQWNFPISFRPTTPKCSIPPPTICTKPPTRGKLNSSVPTLPATTLPSWNPPRAHYPRQHLGGILLHHLCGGGIAQNARALVDRQWWRLGVCFATAARTGPRNPKGMPEWMMINMWSPHVIMRARYIAGTRYKSGDYAPYLYKTTDYGPRPGRKSPRAFLPSISHGWCEDGPARIVVRWYRGRHVHFL